MRNDDLEAALTAWAKDYGYGMPQWLGYPKTNILHPEHGLGSPRNIKIRTVSDDIERVVMDMEASGYWKHAKVLRCDYFLPNVAITSRIDRLMGMGIKVTERSYYTYLSAAKMVVDVARKGLTLRS